MKLEIAGKLDLSVRQDALLVPVIQDLVSEDPLVAGLEGRLEGALGKLILQEEFKGKPGQVLSFNTLGRIGVETVCLMGLGPEQKLSAEAYRRAAGRAADCLRRMRAKKAVIACQVPAGKMVSAEDIAGGLVQGVWLGLYRFDKYKSRNDNGGEKYAGPDKAALFFCDSKGRPAKLSHPGLKEAAARELIIAEGVAGARDLVNEIPEELFPASLAKKAGELTGGIKGLTCRVLDEKQMKKEKMEAALAVGRGSGHGPRFIEIVYKPVGRVRGDGLLVLVGKGVTFDSGGLNIKPGEHMVTMKMDMSGAAVVINAIALIARLRLPVRCAAVVAAVENMPSGRSYKPDDVVRSMNGMTIEVSNTDAEGRVTLADSLSWAVQKLGATRIVDLATLTGACVVGLGPTTAGVFGNDGTWTEAVVEAAGRAGEKVCRLPLDEDMADDIKSEVADVKNVGATRFGGAIAGALFLQKFVGEVPWVHLDIAGPSWADKKRHYEPVGGTGFGVRTLVRLAEKLAAETGKKK